MCVCEWRGARTVGTSLVCVCEGLKGSRKKIEQVITIQNMIVCAKVKVIKIEMNTYRGREEGRREREVKMNVC